MYIQLQKKPIDVFFSNDKILFNNVFENTINASKNYKVDNFHYNKYDYILLFNNFSISYVKKQNLYILKKEKIKKKNCLFNICASILSNEENGLYKILIEKDYDEFKLYKNYICLVDGNLIKKVNYDIWIKILS